ncbi:MAG: arylsulfatase [Puniceicoccaceae bacterium]
MKRLGLKLLFLIVASPFVAIAEQPNILIILVDDMGYSDIGCYGGEIQTPNLDKLAKNGMKFSQMYNTAKCYPTRACLQTGIYFQRTDRDFRNTATLGEVLRPVGYRTLWAGKHHANFSPTTRGYDRHFGLLGGASNHWNPGKSARPGERVPATKGANSWDLDGRIVKDFIPEDRNFYTTDTFTDYALKWLDEYKKEDKPFLLYVAYTAPHWPLHAWPEDIAKYKGDYDVGYDAIREQRYKRQLKMGLFDPEKAPMTVPDRPYDWDSLSPQEKSNEAKRMEVHAAMVDRIDQNIGRLVEKITDLGELDNTLILFLSDNGASPEKPKVKDHDPSAPWGTVGRYDTFGPSWAQVSETPLRKWKGSSHEGGINTPLIAHWPAVIQPTKKWYREPVHLIDILPTILDITGAEYPGESSEADIPPVDGVSFLAALKGGTHQREKPLFFQFGGGSAMRDGKWKLVRSRKEWELYDFSKYRTENQDLAVEMPELVKQMSRAWETWYVECTGEAYKK